MTQNAIMCCLIMKQKSMFMNYLKNVTFVRSVYNKQDLINILKNISSNSIYSVQNDLNKGYINANNFKIKSSKSTSPNALNSSK